MSGFLENLKSQYAHDATVLAGIENGSVLGIPLTQGEIAIIDSEDFHIVSGYRWHVSKYKNVQYALSAKWNKGNPSTILMHRLVMNLKRYDGLMIDHINMNGLDNRKINLRFTDFSLNAHHCKLLSSNTTGFRGIAWNNIRCAWQATIRVYGKRYFLGYYSSKRNAALAYDAAALRYKKDHATLNFPERRNYV